MGSPIHVGQRSIELGRHRIDRPPRFAHLIAFTNAKYDVEPGSQSRAGLGLDVGVSLLLGFAPLAMADDRQPGAGVEQHGRGNAAGVGTLFGLMDVLPADGESRRGSNRAFDQRRRQAQSDVDSGAFRRKRDVRHLAKIGRNPVHLPIARYQLASCH